MQVHTDLTQLPAFQDTVVTIGSFDGVHRGHHFILEKMKTLARAQGGQTVVITFDPHPRSVLKPDDPSFRLLTTAAEKTALLAETGIDHLVIVPFTADFAALSAKEYVESFLVKNFHPRFVVIGYDHRFGNNREGNIAFLLPYQEAGQFTVVEIPAQEIDQIAISSSKIRRALEKAEIQHATQLLGHRFSFTGRVVEGNRIGRTIGFPTANLEIESQYKIRVPQGIYAAWTWVGLDRYPSMLYVGDRPTVVENGPQAIEVNLINFNGDLYGEYLRVELVDYIRPDIKLDGLEALQKQIEQDKIQITAVLNREHDRKVAIVILNYNTRKHLETYLPSVIQYSEGAQIIVADNGSPDDSVQFLKEHFPEVSVLELVRNYGFAEGYNQALNQIPADIYVLLNSDVEVTPGWLEPVLKAMDEDATIGIAQPKILAWRDKTTFEYAGASGGWIDSLGYPFCRGRIFGLVEKDEHQYDQPQQCFWASGAAFFIRAPLFHRFGGFDGDYFAHNEEIDLCWRVKRAGYSIWCIPQSVVYHLGGGTLEYENPRKVFLNFRNSLNSILKNEPVATLFWLIPARLILDGVAGVKFLLQGQTKAVKAIIAAHFSFYRQLPQTLDKRARMREKVEGNRIGPINKEGVFRGSIVFQHYLRRVKLFKDLFFN